MDTDTMRVFAMFVALCDDSPLKQARRDALAAGVAANQLDDDIVTSGAMRGEFRVMLRFVRDEYGRSVMVPVLL